MKFLCSLVRAAPPWRRTRRRRRAAPCGTPRSASAGSRPTSSRAARSSSRCGTPAPASTPCSSGSARSVHLPPARLSLSTDSYAATFPPQMEIEKAFAEERAVWWTLEERGGTRSANASPRGSLTGARALRRGDFASQRSVSGTYVASYRCAIDVVSPLFNPAPLLFR